VLFGLLFGAKFGFLFAPATGLTCGLAATLAVAQEEVPADLSVTTNPRGILARDRNTFFSWLGTASLIGLVLGLIFRQEDFPLRLSQVRRACRLREQGLELALVQRSRGRVRPVRPALGPRDQGPGLDGLPDAGHDEAKSSARTLPRTALCGPEGCSWQRSRSCAR
jgi:hypothetical protein